MIREPDKEVDDLARRVIGCAIEVHRTLGPGFLEALYEHALSRELALNNISHVCQYPVQISYKDVIVGEGRLDFLIEDKLVVEIKSAAGLAPIHTAQLKSYLKSTGLHLGLLINFNENRLADGIKRVILSQ
ncbi:MAG: GxxExxY protein [Acidobacteriota bacterium]|nr:MAG: GxxExxY protein [Acidobacteriota bacterium]